MNADTKSQVEIIAGHVGEWPFPIMDENPGAWVEISEEHWDYSLGAVPPIYFEGGFAVSEASHSDERGRSMYAACVNIGSRYFMRHLAVADMPTRARELRDTLPTIEFCR